MAIPVFNRAFIYHAIQDTNLAAILRDYLAQGRQLPGVRTGLESIPWPSANNTRPAPASTVNNGGDYVASRRALLNQYAARWLLALHDQDIGVYANVLYEICTDLAEDASVYDKLLLGAREASAEKVSQCYFSTTTWVEYFHRTGTRPMLTAFFGAFSNYAKPLSHSVYLMTSFSNG
jgi:hypothetical protein